MGTVIWNGEKLKAFGRTGRDCTGAMMTRVRRDKQLGFTVIELVVVMGILATLMAMTTINLLGLQRRNHLSTSVSTLVTDFYLQRQRSMDGATQGRNSADSYGVRFESDRYILFHGNSYSENDPDNVSMPYAAPMSMSSTTFPNSVVVFAKGSGQIVGFTAGQNTLTLTNTSSNEQVTLSWNQYGTITSVLP